MPKAVFNEIYRTLREEIEQGTYAYQMLLPSESELTQRFGCSRSAVRRALNQLASDGYVQPIQGKGVRLIWSPRTQGVRSGVSGLETFREIAIRRGFTPTTKTLIFEEVVADANLADLTGFTEGSRLTHILRQRFADKNAVGTDESYYLSSKVQGLTPEIVSDSVYAYLEDVCGISIVTSKRTVTVEAANEQDRTYVDLEGFNAIAVMRSNAFDNNAIMVEYTETRQAPGFFELNDIVTRHRRDD